MSTKISTFPLRMPLSLKAAVQRISDKDGSSMNQFLVIAAAEKVAAMETEEFFRAHREHSDEQGFLRILNREGGEPPRPEDYRDGYPGPAAVTNK